MNTRIRRHFDEIEIGQNRVEGYRGSPDLSAFVGELERHLASK
jgi:hypothetical protein